MDREKLKYNLALLAVPNIGSVNAKTLIAYGGGAEGVFKNKKSHLLKINGIGEKTAAEILAFNDWDLIDKEIAFIEKHNIQPLFYLDEKYPYRLKENADAPILLFYKGNADLNAARVISVVGTRKPSDYGKTICEELVSDLAPYNVFIVSGLAYGIDIIAHKTALTHGLNTVGVLAHGLDRIYPSTHRSTAAKMIEKGGLLTEYPSGTNPDAPNFPTRNRIVAGMADATLVVESPLKGGSLITAQLAFSYDREVLAVPGRTTDAASAGCNGFIKTNKAAMVESAADIAYYLGWDSAVPQKKKATEIPKNLGRVETKILEKLTLVEKIDIDSLSAFMELSPSELSLILLQLEFSGYIASLPGKMFRRS
ncbi:MAG: DNA-processing protein DprA [Bacteroidetes bacterium]|nr:DNA-processing protein DprA [Bacteroidota bacterium]